MSESLTTNLPTDGPPNGETGLGVDSTFVRSVAPAAGVTPAGHFTLQELCDEIRILGRLELSGDESGITWMACSPFIFRKWWLEGHPYHNRKRAARRNRHKEN